jgi:hypothetical protein
MPRTRPPRSTRAGHLHAAGAYPALPVRPVATEPADTPRGRSPLAGLHRPATAPRPVVVLRRLDSGRLYAPALIDAVGWPCPVRLDADVSRPRTVLLRPATEIAGQAASTSRPHLDRSGRLVLTTGIRCHLGIDPDAEVIAVACDGHLEIVTVDRMLDAITTLDTLDTLDTLTATTGPGAGTHPSVHSA